MKITRVETFAIEVPIRREVMITSSLGTHSVTRPVLVRLETEDGVVGVGEATVTPPWSGESVWGARAMIDRYLAPEVLGLRVDQPAEALAAMDRAVWGNPFAKAALEMAIFDAWGKTVGRPVYDLLGGPARGAALPIRFSLAALSPEETAANARRRVEWGHRTIKVKVGRDPAADVARARAVREAIGPDIALTVDANGGWTTEQAVRALREMEDLNLLLAEQPVRREDLDGMAEVRRKVSVPIMADEGVFTPWEAEQALRRAACDLIAVYPGKNGGLLPSLEIARLAEPCRVACAVGSNLELDVGTAAMCHLARAASNVDAERYHGDIIGPLYHEVAVVTNPLRMEAGHVWCPESPGLGVEVDWERVASLRLAD